MKVIGASRDSDITILNKESGSNVYLVRVAIEGSFSDLTLLTELLKYVLPAGYKLEYSFFEKREYVSTLTAKDTIRIIIAPAARNSRVVEFTLVPATGDVDINTTYYTDGKAVEYEDVIADVVNVSSRYDSVEVHSIIDASASYTIRWTQGVNNKGEQSSSYNLAFLKKYEYVTEAEAGTSTFVVNADNQVFIEDEETRFIPLAQGTILSSLEKCWVRYNPSHAVEDRDNFQLSNKEQEISGESLCASSAYGVEVNVWDDWWVTEPDIYYTLHYYFKDVEKGDDRTNTKFYIVNNSTNTTTNSVSLVRAIEQSEYKPELDIDSSIIDKDLTELEEEG